MGGQLHRLLRKVLIPTVLASWLGTVPMLAGCGTGSIVADPAQPQSQKAQQTQKSKTLEDVVAPGVSSWDDVDPDTALGPPGRRPFRSLNSKALPNRVLEPKQPGSVDEAVAEPTVPMELTLPAAEALPGDLGSSADVQLTPEIQSLAQSLGNDPLAIFEHVRNTVDFEPYYHGSVKGSHETLLQKAGNDYDLASLMIALLRAAGIPSHYVRGYVKIAADDAASWVGVQDPIAAARILATAGYDVTLIRSKQGTPKFLQLDHVWVEATIVQNGRSKTIVFDPSYKLHSLIPGRNVAREAGVSSGQEALLNEFLDASLADPSLPSISEQPIDLIHTRSASRLATVLGYLETQPTLTMRQIVGGKQIIAEDFRRLPRAPRYTRRIATERFAEIPEAYRQYIRFRIAGLDTTVPIPELASKRVTLTFVGSNPLGGQPGTALRPQLKVGGEVKAEGSTAPAGYFYPFTLDFQRGSQVTDRVVHTVSIGGVYAVALDTQRVSGAKMQAAMDRLRAARTNYGNDVLRDEVIGELLHTLGMLYFGTLDKVTEYSAASEQAVIFHQVNEALLSQDLVLSSSGTLSLDGMGIDAPRNIFGLFSQTNDPAFDAAGNLLALGMAGSAMEDGIFRKALGWPGASTMAVLEEAAQDEIPIYGINVQNAATLLPQLAVPTFIKQSIVNSLNNGLEVLIPAELPETGDWVGTGWIAYSRQTGAAGFLLAGGTAGGSQFMTGPLIDGPISSQVEAIQAEIGFWDGVWNGLVKGDFDESNYNSPAGTTGKIGGSIVSGVLVYGDVRDGAKAIQTIVSTRGSDGWWPLGFATVGLVPVVGDYIKAAKYSDEAADASKAFAKGFTGLDDFDNLKPFTDPAKHNEIVTNLGKVGKTNRITTVGQDTLNGVDIGFGTFTRHNVQGEFVFVPPGKAEDFIRGSGYAGDITSATVGAMGEKVGQSVMEAKGYQTLMDLSKKNPNTHGFDDVRLDTATGDIIIPEYKMLPGQSGTGTVGKGVLDTTISGASAKELSVEWLTNAVDSSLAAGTIDGPTAALIRQAIDNGSVRKELVVVTNRQTGRTVSAQLAKDADLTGMGGLRTTVIQLPDGSIP